MVEPGTKTFQDCKEIKSDTQIKKIKWKENVVIGVS